jgi:glycosyltransferase involved in cell wall biosynthesis
LRVAGGQQMLVDLVAALKENGLPVIVGIPPQSALAELLDTHGIPFITNAAQSASYLVPKGLKYYSNIIKGFFQMTKFLKTNEIPVLYANTFLAALVGVIAGRLRKLPVVFCDHDIGIHRFFSGIVIRLCEKVIVVSGATALKYPPKYKDKIIILFNGIDPSVYTPGKSKLRNQIFRDDDVIVIGYAGRISALKGVNLIPEIAMLVTMEIPAAKFWIVGDPFLKQDEGFLQELRNEIQRRALQQTIILSDFQKDIIDVIRGFDMLILPSEQESFGRILIEAMAIEKPVISTRCGGPEEIILDHKTGFLIPGRNAVSMSEKIIHLCKNKELMHTIGKSGRQHVINNYSLGAQVNKFLEIHNTIVAMHNHTNDL